MKTRRALKAMGGEREKRGPDGTVYQSRKIDEGSDGVRAFVVRCRPGTFEWRYGRRDNAQYQAGATFAQLWERAGIASCGQANLNGSFGGGEGGLPDGRMRALDRVQSISRDIGGPIMRRMVSYCVEGRTPKEMAATYNGQVSDRQMSDTLDLDLLELAKVMGYAG